MNFLFWILTRAECFVVIIYCKNYCRCDFSCCALWVTSECTRNYAAFGAAASTLASSGLVSVLAAVFATVFFGTFAVTSFSPNNLARIMPLSSFEACTFM